MKRPFMPTMSMAADKEHLALLTCEQLGLALDYIDKLQADLIECKEYFLDNCDVVDGDDDQPRPNKEMRLYQMIQETLYGAGNF